LGYRIKYDEVVETRNMHVEKINAQKILV